MKPQTVRSILGLALVLCCTWQAHGVALRAGNSTATTAAEPKLTGLLCREPETTANPAHDDVDVVLEADGRRSLLFTRSVKDSKGKVIGREVAGRQSTVHCATAVPADNKCVPADLNKPVPTCSEVGQSGNCRCTATVNEELKLPYQRQMATETLKLCEAKSQAKQPLRVLMFGLGGGAVPMYIRHRCDSAVIESVESDARVALIAQRLLGFRADNKNKVEIADGEEAAERHATTHHFKEQPQAHYDVVLVDCFDADSHVAPNCRSERFIHSIHALLAADGQVFQNVMENDVKQLLPMYQATFGIDSTIKEAVTKGQFLIHGKAK